MSPGLLVLTPDDAASLAGLHARCFDDCWSAEAMRGLLKDPNVLALGVQSAGRICAFIMGQTVAGETDILTLATDPDQRRRGLAGQMIESLVRRLGERGVSRITLDVAEDNLAARELYRAHGFIEDGRRPRYYKAKRDIPVDAILMSRTLGLGF
ncbi:GNAT family N-acetyltransferase [Hyphomonas sp.]|uniref:GNAT family N-acetyltransferase n=1 Tax=Hyphomonas sp. TaxID=87 RepID=UPI0025B956BF|nr:GNAT family N-acetyltransferase [Hyphomonas sp.]